AIDAGPEARGSLVLRVRVAGAGRKHRAAERPRALVEHEATRRQMVGEGVVDDVAVADARCEEGARRLPRVDSRSLRFPDWTRRLEKPLAGQGFRIGKTAEGRVVRLEFG